MIALVDCNNFYVSCERVFRPDLNGKPVVVLSNNDGCVISRSNEAKELNIPMGAVAYKYEKLFIENNVTVFSTNFELYGDMSNRIMQILQEYCPDIEIYSIDEAFLDFRGLNSIDINEYCQKIRQQVLKWTGIPISIGVANTKALAKVANRIAKKYASKTNSVHIIDTEAKRLKALKWLKIEDVWGVGRKHYLRLKSIYVDNAYKFTQLSDEWVKRNMTVVGLRLKQELLGFPTLDFDKLQAKKSIATTRSFEEYYTEYDQLSERVANLAVVCANKLRQQKSICNTILVFIHTNYFNKSLPQYSQNIVLNLPFSTSSSIEITEFALKGLKKIFRPNYHYKKAGVILLDIKSDTNHQIQLFEARNEKHIEVMKVMDKINTQYANHTLRIASQGTGRVWKMRQERLSPRYTTRLKEIIQIKV